MKEKVKIKTITTVICQMTNRHNRLHSFVISEGMNIASSVLNHFPVVLRRISPSENLVAINDLIKAIVIHKDRVVIDVSFPLSARIKSLIAGIRKDPAIDLIFCAHHPTVMSEIKNKPLLLTPVKKVKSSLISRYFYYKNSAEFCNRLAAYVIAEPENVVA